MSRKTELAILFVMVIVIVGSFGFFIFKDYRFRSVEAQSPQEVAPYLFATAGETKVFKLVHQGCELFVAENIHWQANRSDSVGVSITAGRGCK